MRLYLCGPIRGRELYNFPAFDAEAFRLRRAGYEVVSPVEMDRVNGIHEFTDPLPPCWRRDVMKRDLAAICDCDGMALLPEWATSEGAQPELSVARFLRLPVQTVEEWIEQARLHQETVDEAPAP